MVTVGGINPKQSEEGMMKRYVMIAALAAAIVAFAAHDRAGAMTAATPAGMQSAVDEVTPVEQIRWWGGGHRWGHPHWGYRPHYWGYHPYYYRACGYWTPWGYRPCYRPWGYYHPWGWRHRWW